MGADLISIGFTAKRVNDSDFALGCALGKTWIENVSDSTLLGVSLPQLADIFENWGLINFPGEIDAPLIRRTLLSGLESYQATMDSRDISGWGFLANRVFVVAGGTSYGDEPFYGWSELCVFTDLLPYYPQLANFIGFLGTGIYTKE